MWPLKSHQTSLTDVKGNSQHSKNHSKGVWLQALTAHSCPRAGCGTCQEPRTASQSLPVLLG